jgi:hypothetical protein
MALENKEPGQYIGIYNGKLCQRVSPATQGAVQRVNKNNKIVFEKYYDRFVGKLVNIFTKESDYGKQWCFDFMDEKEVYHLQLPYSNSFAVAFLKMLPNIDLTKKLEFSPSVKEVDGKNQSSLFIKQDGVNIKHAYTKDHQNGLPEMRKVKVKGQEVWDDTDRLAFLEAMVKKDILPKLPRIDSKASESPLNGVTENVAGEDNDF